MKLWRSVLSFFNKHNIVGMFFKGFFGWWSMRWCCTHSEPHGWLDKALIFYIYEGDVLLHRDFIDPVWSSFLANKASSNYLICSIPHCTHESTLPRYACVDFLTLVGFIGAFTSRGITLVLQPSGGEICFCLWQHCWRFLWCLVFSPGRKHNGWYRGRVHTNIIGWGALVGLPFAVQVDAACLMVLLLDSLRRAFFHLESDAGIYLGNKLYIINLLLLSFQEVSFS